MKFIDLFAGLGGFHKALKELGHSCVFASEINASLQALYKINWGIEPVGDIRKIVEETISSIPAHDILCAGFPCQPFSKAGKQAGLNDKVRGTLFDEIVKILEFRKPQYFILENVPFIAKHDNEETWRYMHNELERLNYSVSKEVFSPHEFGIPQHRYRIFIIGSQRSLKKFNWPTPTNIVTDDNSNILEYIDSEPSSYYAVPKENLLCLDIWQEFLEKIPENVNLSTCPIWSMEFGATYPFENEYPYTMTAKELGKYKGSFGVNLEGMPKKEQLLHLPSYARVENEFPSWKKLFIKWNRQLYQNNKQYIADVVTKLSKYTSQSWQKLEWNVKDGERDIYKYIIQFRASGIRVKKVNYFPSLVCTKTQTPIIAWQKRYITKQEGARLQSLDGLTLFENDNASFKALGNAVNSKIVKMIMTNLLN